MKKRFSASELFSLRNDIPINILISNYLKIPSKISEGIFRFVCPLCGESLTATNFKTNLARCFRCKKNFNTIDMVMIVLNFDFIESVSFLQEIQNQELK
ncbi:hypothetical protein KAR91_31080 [Candidatus Pacearchaeota archaeon]|nr:hypothetical protein [Candidatus Pacearchaeota archaeon]